MQNATILALQGINGTLEDLAPLAEIAFRDKGRLSVVHIGFVPLLPAYAIGASPYSTAIVPESWVETRNDMARVLSDQQAETRSYLQHQGLTGEVATLCVEPAAIHDLVAVRAGFADLVVVQKSLRDTETGFDGVMQGLLFEAATPVILNAEANKKALAPEKIMIAWDGGLPALRAVHAALPLLKKAKSVMITCFDPHKTPNADGESPGADLAMWLSHHGCVVTVEEMTAGGQKISDAILSAAKDHLADLVVMGAYGRSRFSEMLFGGTTLRMLKQESLPVFITH